jgi:hypothetical protein
VCVRTRSGALRALRLPPPPPPHGPRFGALASGIGKQSLPCTLTYRMDIGRFVEWIKLSPRHLLPLSLFTGFMLFVSQEWLAVFGLVALADSKGC